MNQKKENIQFYGNCTRSKISEEIRKSKFLIYPSEWYECMPMTILESFREGTLVLASNIGSIKSLIKDKYNGILFNPNDPKDIAAMVVFLSSEGARNISGQSYNVDGGLIPS